MPPTFAYAMVLFAYVCLGALALAIAAMLAILPGTRHHARWLAGGVIGSYPGVFLFQALCVPVLAVVWGLFWLLNRIVLQERFNLIALAEVLLFLGIFSFASIAGFVTGWTAGSEVALGVQLGSALRRTWVARRIRGR